MFTANIHTMSCKRITEMRPASIVPPPPFPGLVHMYDLLCIMCMLPETAFEGDDIARYFDSDRKALIALTSYTTVQFE